MEPNLLDRMLETYKTERKNVTITLQNKIRVSGIVSAFDSYVLVLDGQRRELIYRHAVASLSPQAAHAVQDVQPVQPAKPVQPPRMQKPAPSEPRQKPRSHERPRTPQPRTPQAARAPQPRPEHAVKESGINSGMKEELLKWMQGQKAAK